MIAENTGADIYRIEPKVPYTTNHRDLVDLAKEEQYDFKDKTVIPFSTHGGSGLAGTVNTIKNKLKSANVETDAFTMSRNDMENAPKEVSIWLKKIGAIE